MLDSNKRTLKRKKEVLLFLEGERFRFHDRTKMSSESQFVVCCACLAEDTKLYSLCSVQLIETYSALIGEQVRGGEPATRVCLVCSAQLMKIRAFRERCRKARQLLLEALLRNRKTNPFYGLNWMYDTLAPTHTETINCSPNIQPEETETRNIGTITNTIETPFENNQINIYDPNSLANIIKNETVKVETEANSYSDSDRIDSDSDNDLKILKETDPLNTNMPRNREMQSNKKSQSRTKKPQTNLEQIPKDKTDNVSQDVNTESQNDANPITDAKIKNIRSRKRKTIGTQTKTCKKKKPQFMETKDFAKMYNVEAIFLNKEEQIEDFETRKNSSNYMNALFKCDKCFKGFFIENKYLNHMVIHDPVRGNYACDICQKRCNTRGLMKGHQKMHAIRFSCKQCSFVSKTRHQAKQHFQWHAGKRYECKYCGATFSKPTTHLTHVRLTHPSENVPCDECGERFLSQSGLNVHKKKEHRPIPVSLLHEFKCITCDMQFNNQHALSRHRATSDGECDRSLKWCVVCGEGFADGQALIAHADTHTAVTQHECNLCGKVFPSRERLNRHMLCAHFGQYKPPPQARQVCEVCGKKLSSVSGLRYHMNTHTGATPYKCALCPKSFPSPVVLLTHKRTHTGERPYKCPHCPKAFKQKGALNKHIRVIHTGERSYVCDLCGNAFKQRRILELHLQTVHMELP